MEYAKQFLNKIVHVTIDRSLSSKHPKYGNIYLLNYGYIKDVKAPDGEDVDAYVLGEFEPLNEFDGKCIAIYIEKTTKTISLLLQEKIIPMNK